MLRGRVIITFIDELLDSYLLHKFYEWDGHVAFPRCGFLASFSSWTFFSPMSLIKIALMRCLVFATITSAGHCTTRTIWCMVLSRRLSREQHRQCKRSKYNYSYQYHFILQTLFLKALLHLNQFDDWPVKFTSRTN